jgi:hypothetical protein
MAHADPYLTLGVSRSDRSAAIAAAYQDLARRFHVAGGCRSRWREDLESSFEALLGRPLEPPPPPVAEAAIAVEVDLLADFDGARPSRAEVRAAILQNFTTHEPKSGRIEVLELALLAPAPIELRLAVPVYHPCARCHGAGRVDAYRCDACDGHGLAEERAVVATALADDELVLPLSALGVRSPLLLLRRVCA